MALKRKFVITVGGALTALLIIVAAVLLLDGPSSSPSPTAQSPVTATTPDAAPATGDAAQQDVLAPSDPTSTLKEQSFTIHGITCEAARSSSQALLLDCGDFTQDATPLPGPVFGTASYHLDELAVPCISLQLDKSTMVETCKDGSMSSSR